MNVKIILALYSNLDLLCENNQENEKKFIEKIQDTKKLLLQCVPENDKRTPLDKAYLIDVFKVLLYLFEMYSELEKQDTGNRLPYCISSFLQAICDHFNTKVECMFFVLENQIALMNSCKHGLVYVAAYLAMSDYDSFWYLFQKSTPLSQLFDICKIKTCIQEHLEALCKDAIEDEEKPNIIMVYGYIATHILNQSAIKNYEDVFNKFENDIIEFIHPVKYSYAKIMRDLKNDLGLIESSDGYEKNEKNTQGRFKAKVISKVHVYACEPLWLSFIDRYEKTPYESLNIHKTANLQQIKKQYNKMSDIIKEKYKDMYKVISKSKEENELKNKIVLSEISKHIQSFLGKERIPGEKIMNLFLNKKFRKHITYDYYFQISIDSPYGFERQICQAYKILIDPTQREHLDDYLAKQDLYSCKFGM